MSQPNSYLNLVQFPTRLKVLQQNSVDPFLPWHKFDFLKCFHTPTSSTYSSHMGEDPYKTHFPGRGKCSLGDKIIVEALESGTVYTASNLGMM